MVYPLLYPSLQTHLIEPIHIVGGSSVIGRFLYQFGEFFFVISFCYVVAVHYHPVHELMMEYGKFFPAIALSVDLVDSYIFVVGVYFAFAGIYTEENRLYSRCCLRHNTCCPRRSYRQTGYIASAVGLHIFVHLRVCLSESVYKRIFFLTFRIEYCKGSTLFCQHHRRTICLYGKRFLHGFCKIDGFVRSITQAHSSHHIAFGSDTDACTTSVDTLVFYLLPEFVLGTFHYIALGV